MDMSGGQAPFYMQLREIVRYKIETGEYAPCTALPSENELADTFSTTRQTVRNAIDALVNEGLLRRVAGKGMYVLGKKIQRDLEILQGFTQTMLDRNVTPSIKVVKKVVRPAGEKYGLMFGIRPEDDIFYVKRLCYGDNEPVSLEEIYIPQTLIPKISGIDLSVFSIYEVYELYGINLERAYQTIDLVHLEQNDARMLGISAELPVMLFECTSYDDQGRIIEVSRSYTRGDKCRFSVNFHR